MKDKGLSVADGYRGFVAVLARDLKREA